MKNSSAFAIPVRRQPPHQGWHLPHSPIDLSACLKSARQALIQLSKLTAAVAVSAGAAWCATCLVSIGFDWGYELVQKYAGQPDSPQGVVAAMALWFIVMPVAFSLAFTFLKDSWHGSWLWNLIPAVLITSFSIYDMVTLEATSQDLFQFTPWATAALLCSTLALLLGRKLYSWLAARTKVAAVLLPGFLVSVPAGVFLWVHDNNFAWTLELSLYACALLLAGGIAAFAGRSRRLAQGAAFALATCMPLLLPALINLTANVLSLWLDTMGAGGQLGWRALLSAGLIALVSITATIIGGLTGALPGRRTQQPLS